MALNNSVVCSMLCEGSVPLNGTWSVVRVLPQAQSGCAAAHTTVLATQQVLLGTLINATGAGLCSVVCRAYQPCCTVW